MFTHSTLFIRLARDIGIAVASVVVAFGIGAWLASSIHRDVIAITKQRALRSQLESRNEVLTRLTADYERVQTAHTQVVNAFLPENNPLEFVGAIDSIAAKHAIVHAIRFDTPANTNETLGDSGPSISQVNFTLSLQTNAIIFAEFLKDLEHLPYFVHIGSISIIGQGTTGWRDASNITIQGTLFTRSEQHL